MQSQQTLRLDEALTRARTLEAELVELRASRATLMNENGQLRESATALKQEVERLQRDVKMRADELAPRIESLTDEVSDSAAAVKELKLHVELLSSIYKNAAEEAAQLRAALGSEQKRHAESRSQLAERQLACEAALERAGAESSAHARTREELTAANSKIGDLQRQVAELAAAVARMHPLPAPPAAGHTASAIDVRNTTALLTDAAAISHSQPVMQQASTRSPPRASGNAPNTGGVQRVPSSRQVQVGVLGRQPSIRVDGSDNATASAQALGGSGSANAIPMAPSSGAPASPATISSSSQSALAGSGSPGASPSSTAGTVTVTRRLLVRQNSRSIAVMADMDSEQAAP